MSSRGQVPRKRYGLFALAIVMLLAGAAALILEWNSYVQGGKSLLIWALGLLMIVASTRLVRASNARTNTNSVTPEDQHSGPSAGKRVRPRLWLASVASLIVVAISYYCLREDALGGYHQVWPVYAFASTSVISGLILGYLVVRLLS
jgi:hypothetical protein